MMAWQLLKFCVCMCLCARVHACTHVWVGVWALLSLRVISAQTCAHTHKHACAHKRTSHSHAHPHSLKLVEASVLTTQLMVNIQYTRTRSYICNTQLLAFSLSLSFCYVWIVYFSSLADQKCTHENCTNHGQWSFLLERTTNLLWRIWLNPSSLPEQEQNIKEHRLLKGAGSA